MRKKILAMLLCLACALGCAFGFTACGGGDNTGDGGDKTEQSGTPVKPDGNDEDKTEQTEKPDDNKTDDKTEQGGDKTDDDKTGDGSDEEGEDKTGDDEEKKDETKNAYQVVIDALQAKLDDEYGDGAKILTISKLGNYLGCKIKYGNAVKTVRSATAKNWLDDNGNVFDIEKANRLISNATLWELDGQFVGLYLSDSESATDAALAKTMIESCVGTDFDIICGGVSATTDVAGDYMISNAAKFTVYALLADKDGKVCEYTETLIATKDSGNVYDTVIYNRGSFRSDKKTQTELGALADNYYAEQVRLAKLNTAE